MRELHLNSPEEKRGNLAERYDSWIKQTLNNLISNEVRTYYRNVVRLNEYLVEMQDDLSQSYDPFDEDKQYVKLGESSIKVKNERLANALGRLGLRKQQVLEDTVVLEIPVGIVADELNLDPQTVSNYKYESLRLLRKIMEDDPDE